MVDAALHRRTLFYRDDAGDLHEFRVESTDAAEVDGWARHFARLERTHQARAAAWEERHATFSDLNIDGNRVAEPVEGERAKSGYPWEGPRFSFALLLGEGATWDGPAAYVEVQTEDGRAAYGVETINPAECRGCGGRPLAVHVCCLLCCRTGRDLVIPRGEPRPSRKAMPQPDGLKGGTGGSRRKAKARG